MSSSIRTDRSKWPFWARSVDAAGAVAVPRPRASRGSAPGGASPSATQDDARLVMRPVRNVMTIDLEDWFHVSNFERYIRRDEWQSLETRVQHTVPRLLDLFAQYDTKATFFVLGWIARRFPAMIRRIADAGHELATHGDEHRRVTTQSPREFRDQLVRSRESIEQAGGQEVFGHRAPTYSLRKSTDWAIPVMLDTGFQYDSSIFPFGSRQDPALCDSRFPCFLRGRGADALVEYPLSTVRVAGVNIPIAGGGYFRFLPYSVISLSVQWLNRHGRPAIMYLHPWELDPHQPRVEDAPWLARFRHYHQLEQTEAKLDRLLSEFRFGSIRDVFWSPTTQRYELVPQVEVVSAVA